MMPDALPAATVPFGPNKAVSVWSASVVVPARGCSSIDATLEEHRAFLSSDALRKNPSGSLIDADELKRRYRSGEPIEKLRVELV